jgi:hypothetical protein
VTAAADFSLYLLRLCRRKEFLKARHLPVDAVLAIASVGNASAAIELIELLSF